VLQLWLSHEPEHARRASKAAADGPWASPSPCRGQNQGGRTDTADGLVPNVHHLVAALDAEHEVIKALPHAFPYGAIEHEYGPAGVGPTSVALKAPSSGEIRVGEARIGESSNRPTKEAMLEWPEAIPARRISQPRANGNLPQIK
jgi:hypothetical protein